MKYNKLCESCQDEMESLLNNKSKDSTLESFMTDNQIYKRLCAACYFQYKAPKVNARSKNK